MKIVRQKLSILELETIEYGQFSSISVNRFKKPFFTRSWHHHPELELLLITKGFGQRFVGDNVEEFNEGDLVLLGGHVPHAWISDKSFMDDSSTDYCESLYVQFSHKLFNSRFFEYPELKNVKILVSKASRGIKISDTEKKLIARLMHRMPRLSQLEKILQLIRILDIISRSQYKVLVSENYLEKQHFYISKRMRDIQTYVMENFQKDITIDECAKRINMTVTSFCRFIKNHTNQTFTQYLNDRRIDFAQRLLLNTEIPIKEIAYDCGFNSVAYFNQRFKASTGKSPSAYRDRV